MNRLTGTPAPRDWLIALALCLPGAVCASEAAKTNPPESPPTVSKQDLELDEVLVEGRRAREQRPGWKELQQPIDWLARLVGRFVVDGYVDLHARGNSADFLPVQGRTECIGFGIAPGVQCELKIRWPETKGSGGEEIPGGVSNLNPAVVLYGYEPLHSGIHYIVVDSNGVADSAIGLYIAPDTVQSRSPCVAAPGNCERVVRITARPDLKTVDMRIDLEVDQQKTVSYRFVMHRVPGSPSVVFGRKEKQ